MTDRPNYITPTGFAALRAEYEALFAVERPALVETIAWAAGNGDRSENGDYIYGRKRLREIDRRLDWLAKRMKAARVVDPAQAPDRVRVRFGATVTLVDEDERVRVLTLVGDDETDTGAGRIGWNAPIARALRGAAVGDVRRVTLPAGERAYEVTGIDYPGPERPLPSPVPGDELIDAAVAYGAIGAVAGSTGGHLQTDVGLQDDLNQGLDGEDATTRPEKADDIANGQAYDGDRR